MVQSTDYKTNSAVATERLESKKTCFYQAGIFYLDGRPVPESEANTGLSVNFGTRTGAITYDGRLDNREDLLQLLQGTLSAEASDSEVALRVYEKWGADGLLHLIGDWSLAIWDETRRTLVLASDFAGVRPLYYCVQGMRVVWSPRLDQLIGWIGGVELDEDYVGGLLLAGARPNRTPYRGVFSVPPGHSVSISKDGIKVQRFWKLPIGEEIRYRQESEYEEHLRSLFRDAVRCRLRTGGPILAELSGGLDSSSIICMARDLNVPLVTLTLEHENSIDASFYTAVEKFCGFESIHVPTASHPFLTENHTGGATPAFWERLHIHTASLARQIDAKTYLTGKLGDLIMGNWWDDSDQVAGLLRSGRIGAALGQSLAWSKILRIPIWWVLGRAVLSSLPPALAPVAARPMRDGSYGPLNLEDSITPGFRKRIKLSEADTSLSQAWRHATPERRKHFRALIETLELRKLQPPEPLDHLSYTHPYAHRPLVVFMSSIPVGLVCGPGEPRRLMRRAFQGLWPPELSRRRSKDSFGAVYLNSLRPLAATLLADAQRNEAQPLQVVARGYVDLESLKKRLEQMSHSLDCNEPQLRQIILLELWLRGRENRLRLDVPSPT